MMTDSFCGYPGDRDEALVAFLYDDGEGTERSANERALFDAHLKTCTRCRDELGALRGVRMQLARWAPPEPSFTVVGRQSSVVGQQSPVVSPGRQSWWRDVPLWAQAAAALLFLGAAAGMANLDVRYDANGLSVRTGWSKSAAVDPAAPSSASVARRPAENVDNTGSVDRAPWRAELAALERQLKTELRPAPQATTTDAAGRDLLRRVRAMLDESEKRQQRELALRVAEVIRDVSAQRQADLVKIDRTLGAVQNNLGVEVMKDRQRLNSLLIRTSGRQ
jgi:hypothetical protein